MLGIGQDFRYAWRSLTKKPGVTVVIVLSMALGIGANSAVFSVIDGLLLRPLPYPEPERLASVWLHSPGIGILRDWPSPGQYVDLRNENRSFEKTAIAQSRNFTLTGREKPELLAGMRCESTLLQMLGAKPLRGRLLLPEDDKPGKAPVALLTYGLWRRLFGGAEGIVGQQIVLNGNPYLVAGVLSQDFLLNSEVMPSEGPMDRMDVIVPLPLGADAAQRRGDENYNILVKLKRGVSLEQARADVNGIAARIRVKDKRGETFGMHVTGLQDEVVGNVRRVLLVLMGSVALVLLIACANVANLLLTRATGREKEIAIRTALGAGWQRLARQLFAESIALGLMGGASGLVLAELALYAVRTMRPGNIPRMEEIGINAEVMAFTFGISIATGLLFGIAPAWRAVKQDLNTSMKAGGRSGQSTGGLSVGRHSLRGLLVVSEVAFSLMLLVAAGLLIRSFARLQAVPPGFNPEHVITMRVVASGSKYKEEKAAGRLLQDFEERISRVPGVRAEGFVSGLPMTGTVGWGHVSVEGYAEPPGQELQVDIRVASSNYFRAMEIPLIKGRFFSTQDTPESQQVVIIDEKFARRFWPEGKAVGKHIWFDPKKPMEVAGVVRAVKQYGLDTDEKIAFYMPSQQQPGNGMFLAARTDQDGAATTNGIVNAIRGVEPNTVVYDVRTMAERVHGSVARQRFAATMLSAFAGFALLLAAVGVYGVMAYLVSQSTHDIGVRMALGALPGNIAGLVMRQGTMLAAGGIVLGLFGAAALTRVMSSLLFGVGTLDPPTFALVSVIIASVAAGAAFVPARRATRVDPMVALREE